MDATLGLSESAALLGRTPQELRQMIFAEQIRAEFADGEYRIPIKQIARYVGVHAEPRAVQAVARALHELDAFQNVFGARYDALAPEDAFSRFHRSREANWLERSVAIANLPSVR